MSASPFRLCHRETRTGQNREGIVREIVNVEETSYKNHLTIPSQGCQEKSPVRDAAKSNGGIQ